MTIVFTTEGQIRELSQRNNKLSVLYSQQMPKITGLDAMLNPQTIFFSIEAASSIQKIDVKTQIVHFMEKVGRPQKLAVDWSTENIYYYNAESPLKSIGICNFHDQICSKLIEIDAHKQVSAITVDSVNQVLFYALSSWWVFNSPSYTIYKSNLDGSNVEEIVNTTTGEFIIY